jgi:hypothetical protein
MAGYIKKWNVEEIYRQINSAYFNCSDSRLDGYSTWGIKQDLWKIKWHLDEIIKKCPTFSPEEEWIREQEKNKVIKILKDDI